MLNKRLADRAYIGGEFSIADMAIWPWVVGFKNFGQKLEDFPNLKKWFEETVGAAARAVVKGMAQSASNCARSPASTPTSSARSCSARPRRWSADC